jgi:signal transduction histidine kinase
MTVVFTHEHVPKTIPPDVALCVYRVAQEALQNAIKYSGAREVTVHLRGGKNRLELAVADAGVGFDVDALKDRGLGLISMRERLDQFGGTLEITSTPRCGTHVRAIVPLDEHPKPQAAASA